MRRRGLFTRTVWFLFKHKIKTLLLIIGCYQFGHGTYIYTKAIAAQWLVSKAWSQTIQSTDNQSVKPWPWADTWPIAKLIINGNSLYTLEGSDGSTLAFGPGHMPHTSMPGNLGNSVIVGHRDTHFNRLQHVKTDDVIHVETPDGQYSYKVREIRIAHENQLSVLEDSQQGLLTLITCYPFNSIELNPDYRYVVRAELINREND